MDNSSISVLIGNSSFQYKHYCLQWKFQLDVKWFALNNMHQKMNNFSIPLKQLSDHILKVMLKDIQLLKIYVLTILKKYWNLELKIDFSIHNILEVTLFLSLKVWYKNAHKKIYKQETTNSVLKNFSFGVYTGHSTHLFPKIKQKNLKVNSLSK